MDDEHPAAAMRTAAVALLDALPDAARARVARGWDDPDRRWLEYRPRRRPGGCLADFDRTARKAAHRLLATGLSFPAYAQAMAIMALEEVLDRQEGWARGRHSDDYWVVIFGDPRDRAGDIPWTWRFEGHHLSVTMTVAGDEVSPAPVFLGANPASVRHAGMVVSRPLAPEEELARALLDAMGPAARASAIVSDTAPPDIRSSVLPRAQAGIEPAGVAAAALPPAGRALVDQLVALYLSRLPDPVAAAQAAGIDRGALHFAWEGPTRPAQRHYYRVQASDLLIEYDNTADDGSHAHTVLRRPFSDYGDDVLAEHHAAASPHSGG
ncbi:MAG TPA: DUF3500 domain-containing protein [Pilimelia sp.]|nr:DUF3500 domain-containing protein [Pilimelia sp.]